MEDFMQWMMQMVPVLLGSAVLVYSILSGSQFMTAGYMKVISLGTTVTNFIKESVGLLKYVSS